MLKDRLFSGMQPSRDSLHLGNYLGALLPWCEMQKSYDSVFCIVDLHALTSNPQDLYANTLKTAAQYIAAGIDPEKSLLYVQSHVPAHAQLAWVLSCITTFGEASRMTQFKDKSARNLASNANVGLFTYPILMAADILLFKTRVVPVGQDQKQHLELARDLAKRFNDRFGEVFVIPEPIIHSVSGKICDLQNPTAKMSKTCTTDAGTLFLLDDNDTNRKKIMRAVTDPDGAIEYDPERKPGVSNLLNIFASLAERDVQTIADEYASKNYSTLKSDLAELVCAKFSPIAQRTRELLDDLTHLDEILLNAAARANEIAGSTLLQAFSACGIRESF